jgi:hypothetical protein
MKLKERSAMVLRNARLYTPLPHELSSGRAVFGRLHLEKMIKS